MIKKQINSKVEMSGVLETIDFKINNKGNELFHILSNLYSNPLGAVIRELSTNCNDGHKINNCSDEPFDIILPGKFSSNSFITFRDYGPGMSHEVVTTIFTTFGKSTKTSSNLETGCLGLGSKSPLAITDSFTITSINNGVKTMYSVSKDERNSPKLAIFGTSQTEEANGLSVTVPLSKEYEVRIKQEIKEQLQFFKVKPNILEGSTKLDFNWDNYFYKAKYVIIKDISFTKNNYYGTSENNIVVQGEVQYNFSWTNFHKKLKMNDELENFEIDKENIAVNNFTYQIIQYLKEYTNMIIEMNLGTVSFTPSREDLIYDASTCYNILNSLILSIKDISAEYLKFLNSFENGYHADLCYKEYNHKNYLQSEESIVFDNYYQIFSNNYKIFCEKDTILKLKNGKEWTLDKRVTTRLDKLSYYDRCEIKKIYVNKNDNLSIKSLKSRSSTSETNKTLSLLNELNTTNYKEIKIVFIINSIKNYRDKLINYIKYNNIELKNSNQFISEVVVVIRYDLSDNGIEEFKNFGGLNEQNFVSWDDVLNYSDKFNILNKSNTKNSDFKTVKQVQNLTFLHSKRLDTIRNENTVKIKKEDFRLLKGLYINTFNNQAILNLDNTPYLSNIIHIIGFRKLFEILDHFSNSKLIDFEQPVYFINEKYTKKTMLVNIVDYLKEIISKIKKQNIKNKIYYNIEKVDDTLLRKYAIISAYQINKKDNILYKQSPRSLQLSSEKFKSQYGTFKEYFKINESKEILTKINNFQKYYAFYDFQTYHSLVYLDNINDNRQSEKKLYDELNITIFKYTPEDIFNIHFPLLKHLTSSIKDWTYIKGEIYNKKKQYDEIHKIFQYRVTNARSYNEWSLALKIFRRSYRALIISENLEADDNNDIFLRAINYYIKQSKIEDFKTSLDNFSIKLKKTKK